MRRVVAALSLGVLMGSIWQTGAVEGEDRDGTYYRCRVAHGPEYQGTWGPPQASVWDDLGEVTVG